MRDIEHRLQVSCVKWFRYQHPDKVLIAVPNGGARDAITGARLKAEGVVAGAPDLFLFEPSGTWHGLAIEMKTDKGRQSPQQKQFQQELERKGYRYEVCRSLDGFMAVVSEYLQNIG